MLKRHIGQVEVYALNQHIGTHDGFAFVLEHCCIVADAQRVDGKLAVADLVRCSISANSPKLSSGVLAGSLFSSIRQN